MERIYLKGLFVCFVQFVLFGALYWHFTERIEETFSFEYYLKRSSKEESKEERFLEKEDQLWIEPTPYNSKKWGKTPSHESFNFNEAYFSNSAPPNFIGAGAKKCGTGAFKFFMGHHQHFKQARGGEAHFIYDDAKWALGWPYYQKYFKSYGPNDGSVIFEGTPRYMVENLVPERVKAMNPLMKIVFVFCDPIKRLKSDFMHVPLTKEPHNRIIGAYSKVGDFIDSALPDIKSKLKLHGEDYITDIYHHDIAHSLFTNSIYVHHLKHWLEYFPKNQILILEGEEILKSPQKMAKKTQKFLNLEEEIKDEHFFINKTSGYYCIKNPATLEPHCMSTKAKGRSSKVDPEVLELSEEQEKELNEFFLPYNLQLCEIIGPSLSFLKHIC